MSEVKKSAIRFEMCIRDRGMCQGGKHCLAPSPCPKLLVDHSDYLSVLRRVRALPGVG